MVNKILLMNSGSTAVSLLLIAVGVILAWAVDYWVAGIEITVIGANLMIVGAIGLLLSVLLWATFTRKIHHSRRIPTADAHVLAAIQPWKS